MDDGWVVTGTGLIAAPGKTQEELHRALCQGTRPSRSQPPAPSPPKPAAGDLVSIPIDGFDLRDYVPRRGLKDLSRTSQLACAAAAPLSMVLQGLAPSEVGVVLGSGWGSLRTVVDFEWETCTVSPRFVNPLLFAETVSNVPAGQISILFGWSAFNLTVSCGAASGLEAIREGMDFLEEGRAKVVLAGGADELNLPVLRVLRAEKTASSTPESMPFGLNRGGLIGGEGACMLVLESSEHARLRGVTPQARLMAAGGFSSSAHATKGAFATALVSFVHGFLDKAGLEPEQIDLVAASANGGSVGDWDEAKAIHEVFGHGPRAPLVMVPKAILGETWGASGPLSVAAALESMRTGCIPGRPKGLITDPSLPPINLPLEPVFRPVRNAVILAWAETGYLSAVLLRSPEGNHAQ